jgi:hypothetical protein
MLQFRRIFNCVKYSLFGENRAPYDSYKTIFIHPGVKRYLYKGLPLVMVLWGCFACQSASLGSSAVSSSEVICMTAIDCLTSQQITIRIGHRQIDPTPEVLSQIRDAVGLSNQSARLPGLEDTLNPAVLDLAKVEAFLQGLPNLPDETLAQLQSRVLYLNTSKLRLGTASPITVASLTQGYTLTVPYRPLGQLIQPTLNAAIDIEHAQTLANQAREATQQFNQEVEDLEARVTELQSQPRSESLGEALRSLSLARSKRFAAATVWRDNSTALANTDPTNPTFTADAEAARQAATTYVSPPWTGMPGPG